MTLAAIAVLAKQRGGYVLVRLHEPIGLAALYATLRAALGLAAVHR